jgi:hypothetical protein
MLSWKSVILLGLTALLLLTGGQCVFIATSGNTKDDKHDDTGGATVIVIATGRFIDAPVQGLRYVSGSTTGVTGSDGEFEYEVDGSITFAIGDIVLGNEIRGKEIVTPLDLIPGATVDTTAALNIACTSAYDRIVLGKRYPRSDDAIQAVRCRMARRIDRCGGEGGNAADERRPDERAAAETIS